MSVLGGADVHSIVPDLPRGIMLWCNSLLNKGTALDGKGLG